MSRHQPSRNHVSGVLALLCLLFLGFPIVSESSPLSPQTTLTDRDRQSIEALIFGTGPLGAGACPAYHRWAGFPRGSHIDVLLAKGVAKDKRLQIRSTLEQVSQATHGAISVSIHETNESEPSSQDFQVASMTHDDPTKFGCMTKVGCTHHEWKEPGVLKASRAVQPKNQTPQAYAHDVVGHGILGMCHIRAQAIGGAGQSLMSGGPGVYSGQSSGLLTELDIHVLRMVYASQLSPGATRQDFIRTGLINP